MGENVNFSQKHISVERGSYMKKNRFMAMLAAVCILLTILSYTMATQGSPYVNDEDTQPVDLLPVGSDIALHSVFVPVSSKWPSPTRTITSNSQFPLKVYNNEVVLLQGNLRYDAKPGESPISVATGALAAIIIQGNVTLNGANASGTTGATAAIHVPASSSLTIYSTEDQSRSTDRSAPAYSLTVTGGKGGGAATTSIKPTLADVTVTYSASSDRDGAMVYSASGTVNVQQNATLAMTLSLMVTAMAAGNKTFSDPPVAGNGTIPGSQDVTVQGKYVNNANDVYSVNIAWSAMEFTYTIPSTAEWDPEKHVYTAGSDGDNGTWSCDTTERCPPPKTPPWPMRPRSTSPSCPRVSCPTTTPPCRICLRSP